MSAGFAAPFAGDLAVYLRRRPHCEPYSGQTRAEPGAGASLDGTQVHEQAEEVLREMRLTGDLQGAAPAPAPVKEPHVTLWNRADQKLICGFMAPKQSELDEYLRAHPECEVYAGKGGSSYVPTALEMGAAATALVAAQRALDDALAAWKVSEEEEVVIRNREAVLRAKHDLEAARLKANPGSGAEHSQSEVRVRMWDRSNGRVISGVAAPLERNVEKYLQQRPHCELYTGGRDQQPQKRARAAVDPSLPQKRVKMWNKEKKLVISGHAAPLEQNAEEFLQKNPHCVLYSDLKSPPQKQDVDCTADEILRDMGLACAPQPPSLDPHGIASPVPQAKCARCGLPEATRPGSFCEICFLGQAALRGQELSISCPSISRPSSRESSPHPTSTTQQQLQSFPPQRPTVTPQQQQALQQAQQAQQQAQKWPLQQAQHAQQWSSPQLQQAQQQARQWSLQQAQPAQMSPPQLQEAQQWSLQQAQHAHQTHQQWSQAQQLRQWQHQNMSVHHQAKYAFAQSFQQPQQPLYSWPETYTGPSSPTPPTP